MGAVSAHGAGIRKARTAQAPGTTADPKDEAIRTISAMVNTVPEAVHAMTVTKRVVRHAKSRAAPPKTGRIGRPQRSTGNVSAITRWNIFGDLHS